MAIGKRRISRRATRRLSHRGRGKWFKTWGIPLLCVLAVVVIALAWGSYLKAKSDALANAQEMGEWVLDTDATPIVNLSNPTLIAGYAAPGGNVKKMQDATYGGVTIPLGSCDSIPYALEVPSTMSNGLGVPMVSGAPSLASHVATLKSKGFYVIGVFQVTCFNTTDVATRTQRKGLEMTLLSLFAQAGINDILLVGLPAGSDSADSASVAYLQEVRELFASLPQAMPALGVSLSASAFAGDETDEDGNPLYAGSLTPGRMLSVCNYLVWDTRNEGVFLEETLQAMQYAYVRYNLRLLMSNSNATGIANTSQHGFTRIWEYGR